MAEITTGAAERWFGLPRADERPRDPRNCVPLKVIGRPGRGFLKAERRRRFCTISQTEYAPTDPDYQKDITDRKKDLLRALFAACACASNPAPPLGVGERYEHSAAEPGAGGIYRSEPPVGKRGARGKWRVYEGDKHYAATVAAAVKRVELYTNPDSGLSIDMGADIASCWVRIWIEPAGANGWLVRYRHVYPTKNEVYGLESFDVRDDPIGGGFEEEGTTDSPND